MAELSSPRDKGKGPADSEGSDASDLDLDSMTPRERKLYERMEKNKKRAEQKLGAQIQLILDALNKSKDREVEKGKEREENPESEIRGSNRRSAFKEFKICAPMTFAGSDDDPVKLLEWITSVEQAFRLADTPDSKKVKYATSLLTAGAMMWWNSVENSLPVDQVQSFKWDQFKIQIKEKYCSADMKRELEKKLLNLVQGSMSVTEYEVEFTRLCLLAKCLVATEDRKINMFIDGLDPKIRKMLRIQTFDAYHKAVECARVIEREINRSRAMKSSTLNPVSVVPKKAKTERSLELDRRVQPLNFQKTVARSECRRCGKIHDGPCNESYVKCFNCKEMGHVRSECNRRKGACYECGEMGHYSRDCPSKVIEGDM